MEGASMRIIVSRKFRLPEAAGELEAAFYFNLWSKRYWPIEALREGDTLYLYESPTQRFAWKAKATEVGSIPYESLSGAYRWLTEHYGRFDERQPYLDAPPEAGYCLAFRCRPVKRLDQQKPAGLPLPMLGWSREEALIKACGLD
jgi:hypothetical protein